MKLARFWILTLVAVGILLAVSRPVAAKDAWIQVKSKNFFLIGNASDKDIRKVATRLEQFRETFRQLFGGANLNSPIPTNVVVFKSDASYKNFKPKRADGKIDNFVAGYFQPGADVNYITISTEGEDAETFSIIFHEYVHFILETTFGKSNIPAWFNEGLAEYYSTFQIEDDIKAKLGLPLARHIYLLRENRSMPLDELLNISNYQLHQTGDHSRSIFYAEAWALVHYLIQNRKTDALAKYLDLLARNVTASQAFKDAFEMSTSQMESALQKYVSNRMYQYTVVPFTSKLSFDAQMQISPLSEAMTSAYLGDLLYHTNRADDAEPFLQTALKLQPDLSLANISLGLVRIRQRKFTEAKQLLEKAIAGDPKNHLAFFQYAYLLTREGLDEFGYVRAFDKAEAVKMRESLRKAIALNPLFTESYALLAFVNVVNLEELDDAEKMMRTALKYQPGNQRYLLRLAEVLSRQEKLDDATALAEKIARTADNQEVKSRAESLVSQIAKRKAFYEQKAGYEKGGLVDSSDGPPKIVRQGENSTPPSEAELAKRQEDAINRAINESLRKPAANEQRVTGHVQKIDCKVRPIVFSIKTSETSFTLTSRDFDSLELQSFDPASNNREVGCDTNLSSFYSVITYVPTTTPKGVSRGEIKAIEFVPANFRLLSAEEMKRETKTAFVQSGSPPPPVKIGSTITEADRKADMMKAISDSLPKTSDGQKREMGYLDQIECSKKGMFFHFRTSAKILRLLNSSSASLLINVFVRDLDALQLGCNSKVVDFPVVFIYTDKPDAKAKTDGDIVSLNFVPKSFVLD